ELGVDNPVVGLGGLPGGFAGLGLVHGLAQLHRRLQQGLSLGGDRLGVLALKGRLQVGERRLDGGLVFGRNLVAVLGHGLFGGVHRRVGLIARLDRGLALLVVGLMRLGFLNHGLDVGFGKAAGRLDADRLFLVGRLVLGRDVDDAV